MPAAASSALLGASVVPAGRYWLRRQLCDGLGAVAGCPRTRITRLANTDGSRPTRGFAFLFLRLAIHLNHPFPVPRFPLVSLWQSQARCTMSDKSLSTELRPDCDGTDPYYGILSVEVLSQPLCYRTPAPSPMSSDVSRHWGSRPRA